MSIMCCGVKARWVTISPRIEYWYCGECKKEVKEETAAEARKRLSSTPVEHIQPHTLTQQEIDELFNQLRGVPFVAFNSVLPGVPDETI